MFAIANGRKALWQWDLNQQLTVAGSCTEVHYLDKGALSTLTVAVKDGKADIPNVLLQRPGRLVVYAYIVDAQDHHTKICETFGISARPKPDDYVYTETEVKTWSNLQSQIGDLDNLVTEEKNNLVAAINEVAADVSEGIALDTTLTQSGKAADAKAVGDALAEKADITDIPAALPNPNALTFTGAVNATYDGSTAVSLEIPSGGSGGTDISLGLTSASVGQTIKVKAIDESGKPTAWEALDRAWKVAETYLLKDMTFPAAISIPQGKDSLLMLSGTDITPDKNTNVNITMGTAKQQSGYSTRWAFTQKMYAHSWGCGMFLELNYLRDGIAHFWMRQTGWAADTHKYQIFEDKPTGETDRFFYVLSVDNAENINKNTTANIILYTRDAL